MNTILRIIEQVRNMGYNVDGIIQHSYNPLSNDVINFLVYSGNRISHIVSTYRDRLDARRKLYKQNDLMEKILRKVEGTPIRENILFSTWLLELPAGCFRIQEVSDRNSSFKVSAFDSSDLKTYLDVSTDWIIDFQEITKNTKAPVPPSTIRKKIADEIEKLNSLYFRDPGVLNLLSLLGSRIHCIRTPMMLAMHHGDYCFWNTFVDTANTFRVVDWEFAKESEWVVIDVFSNLLVTWSVLKRRGLTNEALDTFFHPRGHAEVLLSEKISELKRLHGFDGDEIRVYLAYAFVRLFLRQERPTARIHWEPYLNDMVSILGSINEPRNCPQS